MFSDNSNANSGHRSVRQDRAFLFFEFSIRKDFGVLHQHILERDSHILESKIPVVNNIESQFVANLSNNNPWEGFVSFQVAQLDNERMQTEALLLDVKLRDDYREVRCVTETSRPPLK